MWTPKTRTYWAIPALFCLTIGFLSGCVADSFVIEKEGFVATDESWKSHRYCDALLTERETRKEIWVNNGFQGFGYDERTTAQFDEIESDVAADMRRSGLYGQPDAYAILLNEVKRRFWKQHRVAWIDVNDVAVMSSAITDVDPFRDPCSKRDE